MVLDVYAKFQLKIREKIFQLFLEGRYDFPYEIKKDAQEKFTRNRGEIGQFISNIFDLESKMLKL